MNIKKILYLSAAMMLASCTAEETEADVVQSGTLQFTTSVEDFAGETMTRTSLDGKYFEYGDKIKLKIICPQSTDTELGESTYGASCDNFYLMKWAKADDKHTSDYWATLTKKDGYDIDGDYSASASPDIYSRFLAQPTLYVFTAQTWSEEQIFRTGVNSRVEQYSNVFHADQSNIKNYKASDVMWAQTIMQTGTYNIHLSFKHVMAALLITIDDSNNPITLTDPLLTVEGMPDVDQYEMIVGDYYASNTKGTNDFGYKVKNACTDKAQNGTVIGVAQINSSSATSTPIDVSKKATYTAYKVDNKTYRLIVPPCTLTANPTIWLRDGSKRYSMELKLKNKEFKAGCLYNVTMKIQKDEV